MQKPKPKLSKTQGSTALAKMSEAQRQAVIMRAVETTLHHKPLSDKVRQALPSKVVKALAETLEYQTKQTQLGKFKTMPSRLANLVSRLRSLGIMDKPSKAPDPLDQLDPTQRSRQEAVEAVELRRQNAVRMVNAQKLLPKRSTT